MSLSFIVPLVPPSVNHYVKHTRTGKRYVTAEADAFKAAVCLFAHGEYVQGKSFYVSLGITLGAGDKGDVDNFPKVVLDGLAASGAFRSPKGHLLSDAHISHLEVKVDRNTRPERGETRIEVRPI